VFCIIIFIRWCLGTTVVLHKRHIRIIHYTLSLTNSSLLTADSILYFIKKILFPIDGFLFLFRKKKKIYNPLLLHCPFATSNSCTPPKSNLYIADSLIAVVSEPNLYRFLTFHVPNLMSLLRCLGCTKGKSRPEAIVSVA